MAATTQEPAYHRPRLLTPAVKKTICKAIKAGAKLEIAARAAGIGARTLDEWLKHGRDELQVDPDASGPCAAFVSEVMIASAKNEQELIGIIRKEAPKTWQAAAWLLERKFPQRYARVDRLRVSGDEVNEKPVAAQSREEGTRKLIEKIAAIAEKAADRSRNDNPPVIAGEVIEADTTR